MSRPPLSEIAAFCAIVAHRSFRQAADELNLNPSTLSHTIKGLESRLGIRLLHRTTRSVAPTEAGAELFERMAPLVREFDAAIEASRRFRDTVSGTVRISAAAPAIGQLFDGAVQRIRDTYPDVHVEFVVDGRMVDIVEEGFDAGIRIGDTVPRDMIGVPFGPSSRFVAVASDPYVERFGRPKQPEDLQDHRCIGMRLTSGRLLSWRFVRGGIIRTVDPGSALILGDVPLMIAAATRHLGVAYVWEEAARSHVETGELTILMPDWAPDAGRLLLYYPGNRRVTPALRALIEAIRGMDKASDP